MIVVRRVVMPVSESVSWTVVGDDGTVIEPIEKYLAYLTALERSPNTVVAHATSLRLFFEFCRRADLAWAEVGAEDVARFAAHAS
jgi:site-specific recombinase XerD